MNQHLIHQFKIMINLLSYMGLSLQSEVCLWTMLGLLRTIFDATLFKVNANLKQVWAMSMPVEMPVKLQLVLRGMVSGVMLVQCFTVYFYLATYIMLLYPVILEERPILLLPWLLLAAVRKLLCELMNLAMGLGICVLLGAARPACIKFVIIKIAAIMPLGYMWMLVLSYYQSLKIASSLGTVPAASLPSNEPDYGLELAVRRRRTKSLFSEDLLRKKLLNSFYDDSVDVLQLNPRSVSPSVAAQQRDSSVASSNEDDKPIIVSEDNNRLAASAADLATASVRTRSPTCVVSHRLLSDRGFSIYDDWVGNEVSVPRDVDRILEQFVLMMLRLGAYLKKAGIKRGADIGADPSNIFTELPDSHASAGALLLTRGLDSAVDTPTVGMRASRHASYLSDYPNIFMKKQFETKFKNTADIRHQQSSSSSSDSIEANHIEMKQDWVNIRIDKSPVYEMTRIKSATSAVSTGSTILLSYSKRSGTDKSNKNTVCDFDKSSKGNVAHPPSTSKH